jgi:hypothetical protein
VEKYGYILVSFLFLLSNTMETMIVIYKTNFMAALKSMFAGTAINNLLKMKDIHFNVLHIFCLSRKFKKITV